NGHAVCPRPAALHSRAVTDPDVVEAKLFRLFRGSQDGGQIRLGGIVTNVVPRMEQQTKLNCLRAHSALPRHVRSRDSLVDRHMISGYRQASSIILAGWPGDPTPGPAGLRPR